ncbi:hypothetical protein BGZ94_004336, partial [Podila epigama]
LKHHGHYCQKLFVARDVNHWCSRIRSALLLMPNLLQLEAPWMNADLLESVLQLQHLEHLAVPRMQGSHPDEHSFSLLSFTGSNKITYLDLSDSHIAHDQVLVQIIRACPKIQVLALASNRCLTDAALREWCEGISGKDESMMETTNNSNNSNNNHLNHRPLSLLPSDKSTCLTSINFSNCNRIRTEGFEALFRHSHQLQDLNLMSTAVGDKALELLAENNARLRSLVVNCCAAISAHGLSRILQTSQHLESVAFLFCSRVSAKVFFQTPLWACVRLKELRFSLNKQHLTWIEHGLNPVENEKMAALVALLFGGGGRNGGGSEGEGEGEGEGAENDGNNADEIHEPLFQYFVNGIDKENAGNISSNAPADESTLEETMLDPEVSSSRPLTIQDYRQRLVVSQFYRQIERLTELKLLDMRDLHLPFRIESGLWRLARMARLERLEISGLEAPLGPQEIGWLVGDGVVKQKKQQLPLPMLQQLVFKSGHGMSAMGREVVSRCRPGLVL